MRGSLLLLVACVHFDPPEYGNIDCELAAGGLKCTAHNTSAATAVLCAQPVVGVLATGAIYEPHERMCSVELGPYGAQSWLEPLDIVLPRMCGADLSGCVVRMFHADSPSDAAPVVAFARQLALSARDPGRDRPSLGECEALLAAWRHDDRFPGRRALGDAALVGCMMQSRVAFDCLLYAQSDRDADACRP